MQAMLLKNQGTADGEEFKKRIISRHQVSIKQIDEQKNLYEYLAGYKSFIKLKYSEHLTFTDLPLIYNQEMENDILPIKEAHKIISEITVKFYNEFLLGIKGDYTRFIGSCPHICIIDKDGEQVR
jgi:hypothetical protein